MYKAMWICPEGMLNPFPVSHMAYNPKELGDAEKQAALVCSMCASKNKCDGLEVKVIKSHANPGLKTKPSAAGHDAEATK